MRFKLAFSIAIALALPSAGSAQNFDFFDVALSNTVAENAAILTGKGYDCADKGDKTLCAGTLEFISLTENEIAFSCKTLAICTNEIDYVATRLTVEGVAQNMVSEPIEWINLFDRQSPLIDQFCGTNIDGDRVCVFDIGPTVVFKRAGSKPTVLGIISQ